MPVNLDKEVQQILKSMIHMVGTGFHPDTPFDDYIVVKTNQPSFTEPEAKKLQLCLDFLHDYLGDTIYDIGLEYMNSPDNDEQALLDFAKTSVNDIQDSLDKAELEVALSKATALHLAATYITTPLRSKALALTTDLVLTIQAFNYTTEHDYAMSVAAVWCHHMKTPLDDTPLNSD